MYVLNVLLIFNLLNERANLKKLTIAFNNRSFCMNQNMNLKHCTVIKSLDESSHLN